MASEAMSAALSLGEMREQLRSLESERDVWAAQRQRLQQRREWLERAPQLRRAKVAALARAVDETDARLNGDNDALESSTTPSETVLVEAAPARSKREEMQELREKAMQLVKKQQQFASKMTSQLRTIANDKRTPTPTPPPPTPTPTPTKVMASASVVGSRSPPQAPQQRPPKRCNKLVLVPTTTNALGKRVPGIANTAAVTFPPLVESKDVPSGSVEELEAVAMRVASRHFLQTGEKISVLALRQLMQEYIGHSLPTERVRSILEHWHQAPLRVLVSDPDDEYANDRQSTRQRSTLDDPTESIGASVEQIRSWIQAEKAAVDEVVASWGAYSHNPTRVETLVGVLNAHAFTSRWAEHPPRAQAPTIDGVLSRILGAGSSWNSSMELETAFPHILPVLHEAQQWLSTCVNSMDAQLPTTMNESARSADGKFTRPFDLDGSVMKQLATSHGVKRRRKQRADPMKVMCMYELSGACNDASCAFQHQRDFGGADASDEETKECDGCPDNRGALVPSSTKSLMNQFVQLREDLRGRWPAFVGLLNQRKHPAKAPKPDEKQDGNPDVTMLDGQPNDATTASGFGDFLSLGSPLSPSSGEDTTMTLSSRYCDDGSPHTEGDSSSLFSIPALESHVVGHLEDVDAWLLLALRSLEIEVSWSDETVRLTESSRLRGELEELCALFQPARSNAEATVSDNKLEQSLRVLSRALEVEANAYCEVLWLFHLRLSQLLTNGRDVEAELQMTEQALGFVRTSVPLWRHFLTLQVSSLDRLDETVATYTTLLEAISTASQQSKKRVVKDAFSVLLCDVVIQLCSTYCNAGRSADALAVLWSLLEGRETDCQENRHDIGEDEQVSSRLSHTVRDRIIGDDILMLYVLHVHIALFGAVPLWLREREFHVNDAVNVYRMLLPFHARVTRSSEALEICKAARHAFRDSKLPPPGLEVLLHNWVVILATSIDISEPERLDLLTNFADVEQRRETLLPRVMTALATVFRHCLHKPKVASQSIEELMVRYKTVSSTLPVTHVYQRFGEALHHYLLHRSDLFAANPFQSEFPTLKFMIVRLAAIVPTKDPLYSKPSIKNITNQLNMTARHEVLVVLFSALLRDTMQHIVQCQLGQAGPGESDEQDITQDTYYLVAQAQLLGQVCGARTAIETLDAIVIQNGSASKWSVLPHECRRMVWSVRFTLQLELLKQDDALSPSQELMQLLDRYVADVGPLSDTTSNRKQRLGEQFEGAGGDGAMPALREAIAACVEYTGCSAPLTSTLDIELFRLCLASISAHERPLQFTTYQHRLGMYPSFLLDHADAALQDSDWRRVRSALRRMVGQNPRSMDPRALRALVLLELKDKNVHGACHALGHRLAMNPLDGTAWELVGMLEVLFGSSSDPTRANDFAAAVEKTGGVQIPFRPLLGNGPVEVTNETCVNWTASLLIRVPTTAMLNVVSSLEYLDLSNNLLSILPPSICRLSRLRVLKLSGNSLVALPPSIGQLAQLHEIALAHNNLSTIPNTFWDGLLALRDVDLRCNALSVVSPRVVRLQHLQRLRVGGNNFSWTDFQPIAAKLPAAASVDIAPARDDKQPAVPEAAPEEAAADGRIDERKSDQEESKMPDEAASSALPSQDGIIVESKLVQRTDADDAGPTTAAVKVSPDQLREEPSDSSRITGAAAIEQQTRSPPSPMGREQMDIIDIADDDDDDKEEESKSEDGRGDTGPQHSGSPVDVVMAHPDHDENNSDDDDDDEVECLGSSSPRTESRPSSANTTASSTQQTPSHARSSHISQISQIPEGFTADEWRRHVGGHIQEHTDFPDCSLCQAANGSGTHQRFGHLCLCLACMEVALDVLRDRATAGASQRSGC